MSIAQSGLNVMICDSLRKREAEIVIRRPVLGGQMGQKRTDFILTHLSGMPLLVRENVSLDPVEVGLFGSDTVVFEPDYIADLIK